MRLICLTIVRPPYLAGGFADATKLRAGIAPRIGRAAYVGTRPVPIFGSGQDFAAVGGSCKPVAEPVCMLVSERPDQRVGAELAGRVETEPHGLGGGFAAGVNVELA
jgi:hypothetical protein